MNHQNKRDEMYTRLVEDTKSDAEAEALLPIVQQLRDWSAPEASREQTARLIARLERELPIQSPISNLQSFWPWLLLRSQMRVVRGEIWAASALVMLVGTLVTLAFSAPGISIDALPIVFVAPVVAAIGMAFLYGGEVDPPLEIQLATPVSPRLILLTRLSLVYSIDLILGLLASVALSASLTGVSLWPLVMTWLAPMAFLSALAFVATIVSAEPVVGMLISIVIWAAQIVGKAIAGAGGYWPLPDLASTVARPWLWLAAVALIGFGLWVAGREERWVAKSS